eukprot:483922-Rhodomonas_salina.1
MRAAYFGCIVAAVFGCAVAINGGTDPIPGTEAICGSTCAISGSTEAICGSTEAISGTGGQAFEEKALRVTAEEKNRKLQAQVSQVTRPRPYTLHPTP